MKHASKRQAFVDIYGLIDPRTGRLRYIGKADSANERLRTHLRDIWRRKTPLYRWLSELVSDGLVPQVVILAKCGWQGWRDVEIAYIAEARARGESLLNVARGGDQPFCPASVRAANGPKAVMARSATSTKVRLWRLKRALGSDLKAGFVSEATRAKIRSRPDVFGKLAAIA